ncbi:MAG: aminotransferase class III-fold pyridoxal phosphate-dependent enzyme [Clostridia bacterium]|nr:aminotransferase class III-fold pyridoxal phosphate-dependent enzyme [Clostridia bacterium]
MGWMYPQEMYYIEDKSGERIIFSGGEGAYLYDANGKNYIDFWNGFGSILLGYNDPDVVNAIKEIIDSKAFSLQAPTNYLNLLGDKILEDYPGKDSLAIYPGGTPAVRAAVQTAVNASKGDIILSAGYHGWDPMWEMSKAPFEPNGYGVIDFYFIPEKLEALAEKYRNRIAAVVISPDLSYFSEAYYKNIWKICKDHGLTTILDDVKCGYRYSIGPSLSPEVFPADMYIISKCIANGARISCVIGAKDMMEHIKYYCFTSFYDVFAAASAVCTLNKIKEKNVIREIRKVGDYFIKEAMKKMEEVKLPITIRGNGNLFQIVFEEEELSEAFYKESVENGLIFFKEDNQCISYAFTEEVCQEALNRLQKVLDVLSKRFPASLGKSVSKEQIFKTAYNQIDGCIEDMSYEDKIKFVKDLYSA